MLVPNGLRVIANRKSLPPYWTRAVGGRQYGAQAKDNETAEAQDGYNWRMAAKKAGAKFVAVKASFAQQRGWRIFSFVIDSTTFDRIAFVSRRDDDKDAGYQRNLSKQRQPTSRATSTRRMGVFRTVFSST